MSEHFRRYPEERINFMNVKETLRALCAADGVSGEEKRACDAALGLLRGYCPAAEADDFGNVTAKIGSDGAKKTLMLEAHIDEIGLIVTYIDEKGFIKTAKCGGIDRRLLLAQTVTIHGKKDIKGVISTLPPHVAKDGAKAPEIDDIAVDAGFSKSELEQIVSPGDKITIDSAFSDLLGTQVTGKATDDRSGCAAILYALELLRGKELAYNLCVVFASQEETGGSGAKIASYRAAANLAVAVDVSFAQTPGVPEEKARKIGEGPMIGIAACLDRRLFERLKALAENAGIKYQIEAMGGDSGTDADDISVSRGGVRSALISIPQKYMHTPVEVVDAEDIKAVGALIAELAQKGGEV